MRLSIHAVPATLVAALGVISMACATHPADPVPNGPGFVPAVQPVSCPKFDLTTTEINVGPAGGSFAIGPNHTLEFWPGAVSAPATYRVQKGPKAKSPQYWAEVDIHPMNGAPTTFQADVILDLSYKSCPGLDDVVEELVLVKTSPPRRGIGGRDDRGRRAIRALVPHLSMFAIAH